LILSYMFDALLSRNWAFSAPNRRTLQISLLLSYICFKFHVVCYELYHIEVLASIKVHNYKHIITILMRNTHTIITHLVKWGPMPYIKSSTKTCKIEKLKNLDQTFENFKITWTWYKLKEIQLEKDKSHAPHVWDIIPNSK
jgi:hypothetical protein